MKNDKIVLGVTTQNGQTATIDINTSKLDAPFKGCIVANILCGEYESHIIYGIVSVDFDNGLLVFTAENGDVYKFDINYNEES